MFFKTRPFVGENIHKKIFGMFFIMLIRLDDSIMQLEFLLNAFPGLSQNRTRNIPHIPHVLCVKQIVQKIQISSNTKQFSLTGFYFLTSKPQHLVV